MPETTQYCIMSYVILYQSEPASEKRPLYAFFDLLSPTLITLTVSHCGGRRSCHARELSTHLLTDMMYGSGMAMVLVLMWVRLPSCHAIVPY